MQNIFVAWKKRPQDPASGVWIICTNIQKIEAFVFEILAVGQNLTGHFWVVYFEGFSFFGHTSLKPARCSLGYQVSTHGYITRQSRCFINTRVAWNSVKASQWKSKHGVSIVPCQWCPLEIMFWGSHFTIFTEPHLRTISSIAVPSPANHFAIRTSCCKSMNGRH